jgi:hypothetical protein
MPGAVMDQYLGGGLLPLGAEMGPLPWDAAETPQGPEAIFKNTPAYQELSESDQAAIDTFFETAIQGEGAAHADEIAAQLAQLLESRDIWDDRVTAQQALTVITSFNQSPQAADSELAREILTNMSPSESAPVALSSEETTGIFRMREKSGRLGTRAQCG